MKKANQKFGKINPSVGFRQTDGVIKSNDSYLSELEKKGYQIERTNAGIVILPPIKK